MQNKIFVRQIHEIGEWLGFETRNKYEFTDENKTPLAYAAEQQKGILGFLFRQYLGHWRRFDIHFFTPHRQLLMVAHHPFRWFFQRMEITDANNKYLGAIQQRFSIFSKRFDLEDQNGSVFLEVKSPIWRIWTFTLTRMGRKCAEIKKKWSGILSEAFTDRDNFMIEFFDTSISEDQAKVVMAAAVFVDLQYFERKAD